jgi:hypothetical protein
MVGRQLCKSLRAGCDNPGLQSSYCFILEARDIGETADHPSGSGRQAGVSIEEQPEGLLISCHGLPERRRRLPGSPGNSRDRRSKGARCAGPCRWCSTFRNCSVLPASRIARSWSELAWGPLGKTLPEHGRLRQGEGEHGARVAHLPWRENVTPRRVLDQFSITQIIRQLE